MIVERRDVRTAPAEIPGAGLLVPLSWGYGAVTSIRNRLYDHGWFAVRRLPCRVISIGNVTVGGTGKTPLVIWAVERLLAAGYRVGVLSRGYRRHSRVSRVLVSDGCRLLATPQEAGDEPFLIAERCPSAVVAVGAKRYDVGRWLLDRHPVDCLVLDDGFQHRSLHRDADIVLIDATDSLGLRGMVPYGRLREPLSGLARASAVVLSRVARDADTDEVWSQVAAAGGGDPARIAVRFAGDRYVDVSSGAEESLGHVRGRRALTLCGIANPASFTRMVAEAGVSIVDRMVWPDHHRYEEGDLSQAVHRARQAGADLIVMTEKDAVKLRPWAVKHDMPMGAVRLSVDVVQGQERLERLILGSAEC